jgi:hypothetical protein
MGAVVVKLACGVVGWCVAWPPQRRGMGDRWFGPASRWWKRPDVPLGEVVEWKLQRRARRAAVSVRRQV